MRKVQGQIPKPVLIDTWMGVEGGRSFNRVKRGEHMSFSPLPPESLLEKCSSRGGAPTFRKMHREGQMRTKSKEHIRNGRAAEGMPDDPAKPRQQDGQRVSYLKRKAWLGV